MESGLIAHPNYMVYRQFVAENYFLVIIDVDNGVKAGVWQSEIIKESRILPIRICIVLIVGSAFVVA